LTLSRGIQFCSEVIDEVGKIIDVDVLAKVWTFCTSESGSSSLVSATFSAVGRFRFRWSWEGITN